MMWKKSDRFLSSVMRIHVEIIRHWFEECPVVYVLCVFVCREHDEGGGGHRGKLHKRHGNEWVACPVVALCSAPTSSRVVHPRRMRYHIKHLCLCIMHTGGAYLTLGVRRVAFCRLGDMIFKRIIHLSTF